MIYKLQTARIHLFENPIFLFFFNIHVRTFARAKLYINIPHQYTYKYTVLYIV